MPKVLATDDVIPSANRISDANLLASTPTDRNFASGCCGFIAYVQGIGDFFPKTAVLPLKSTYFSLAFLKTPLYY
jgi:hypothetical protein